MRKKKILLVLAILAAGMAFMIYEISLLGSESFENGESYVYVFFSALGAYFLSWFLVRLHEIKPIPQDVKAAARVRYGLYGSLFLNIVFALGQLWLGVINHSFWFISFFLFYLVLAAIRLVLASLLKPSMGGNLAMEYKWSRLCGIGLMVLNAVLSLIVFYIAHRQQGFQYPAWLTIFMIGYTAYLVLMSSWNLFHYRKCGSPVLYALMLVNFTFSMSAVLTLETAFIYSFNSTILPEVRQAITGITGATICSVIWIIAFFMVLDANAAIRKLEQKSSC